MAGRAQRPGDRRPAAGRPRALQPPDGHRPFDLRAHRPPPRPAHLRQDRRLDPRRREGLKQMAAAFQAAFTESHTTLDDLVAEGDKLACRWSVRARHTGEFMGIPATGKEVTYSGTEIDRIAGGKFVERWSHQDDL